MGYGNGLKATYVTGTLHQVLAVGDSLDGERVQDLGLGSTIPVKMT